MKFSKILSTILALVMVIGCFAALPASAATLQEGGTIYVSAEGDDTADGLTEGTAVATVGKATEIIAAANIKAATVKIMGVVTVPKMTETAHPDTVITYTGNDADAQWKFGGNFTMNGPCIFKDLKFDTTSNQRRMYYGNNKLVMDTGLTMTGSKRLKVHPGYGAVTTLDGVNLTINSGTYGTVDVVDVGGCTVTGDINVTINGENTDIQGLYLGGGSETNGAFVINGKMNVVINDGLIQTLRIGAQKSGSNSTILNNIIYIKINGGSMKYGDYFGLSPSNALLTEFKENGRVIVDLSNYDDQVDEENPENMKLAQSWKDHLNNKDLDTEDEDIAALMSKFTVTDASVAGMQQSNDKTAVRFVVGIRDYNDVSASITVVAKKNGEIVKTFENVEIKQVFTSVIANENGVNTTVTAAELDANYIMALTITGIPAGVVDCFEVTPTINGIAAPMTAFAYPAA